MSETSPGRRPMSTIAERLHVLAEQAYSRELCDALREAAADLRRMEGEIAEAHRVHAAMCETLREAVAELRRVGISALKEKLEAAGERG